MSRLPVVSFRQTERVLFRLGFVAVRQRGSHVFYAIPMAEPQQYPITPEETWRDR